MNSGPMFTFNPSVDYDLILALFLEEFNTRWNSVTPSPENGLAGFEEVAIIGSGSFGKVALIKERKTGDYYAVKQMLKDKIVKVKEVAHVHNEKRVLASIKFPTLIWLEFSRKDFDQIYLGMPYIGGGELFSYHRKMRKFSEKQARFYAAQVFLGLEYLHFVHLIYRDLKPENIMLDEKGYIKITDFGFAKKVKTRTMTLCGTPEYFAPEIIQAKPYGSCVDWWSFGVLVYEMVFGSSPFSKYSRDKMVMYAKICEGDYKMPQIFSTALKDLIFNLLQVDLSRRFGSLINGNKDIKDHAWFKAIDWFAILNQEVHAPYIPEMMQPDDFYSFDRFPEHTRTPQSKFCRHCDLFEEF
ncbi:cAMP-dependent protein kinase catalytic subunit 2-like isoform X1 [Anastrepha obliqua]|uniref:cAMP-dependent protein kinase catalytic subunit 2-like isoform X1 n=1 Tax=Anastrepha obliqua TaxID=95512 RepID=UPI00240A8F0B|nr:cAMP-dependent protein kinase catalytic subunit 2-like isoform X1 [Anastrepha obliqua]